MADAFANAVGGQQVIAAGNRSDALDRLFPESQSASVGMDMNKFMNITIPNTASLGDLAQYAFLGTQFVTEFLLKNPNEFMLTDIAPITVSLATTRAWSKVIMEMDVADQTEEFEAPNLVGHRFESYLNRSVRYMKGFKISSETLHTPTGRQMLLMKYRQLAAYMTNSMALGVYLALLECHEAHDAVKLFLGKQYGNLPFEKVLQWQKDLFAAFALGDREQVIYAKAIVSMQERSGTLDTAIFPAGSKINMQYRDNNQSNKNRADKDGDIGVNRQYSDAEAVGSVFQGKIRAYQSGTWPHESQSNVLEPGNIPTAVGERYDMNNITSPSGNIKIYNITKDRPEEIKFKQSLLHSGVWDTARGCFSDMVYKAIAKWNNMVDARAKQDPRNMFALATLSGMGGDGTFAVPATHVGKVMRGTKTGEMAQALERFQNAFAFGLDEQRIGEIARAVEDAFGAFGATNAEILASLAVIQAAVTRGVPAAGARAAPGLASTAAYGVLAGAGVATMGSAELGGRLGAAMTALSSLATKLQQMFPGSKLFEGKLAGETVEDMLLRDFFVPVNPVFVGALDVQAGDVPSAQTFAATVDSIMRDLVNPAIPYPVAVNLAGASDDTARFVTMIMGMSTLLSTGPEWTITQAQLKNLLNNLTLEEQTALKKFSKKFSPYTEDGDARAMIDRNVIVLNILKSKMADKNKDLTKPALKVLGNPDALIKSFESKPDLKSADDIQPGAAGVLAITVSTDVRVQGARRGVAIIPGFYLTPRVLDVLMADYTARVAPGGQGLAGSEITAMVIMDPETHQFVAIADYLRDQARFDKLKQYLMAKQYGIHSVSSSFSCVREFLAAAAAQRQANAPQAQQHGNLAGDIQKQLIAQFVNRFQVHRIHGDYYHDFTGKGMAENFAELIRMYPPGSPGYILGAFYLFHPIDSLDAVNNLISRGMAVPLRVMAVRNQITMNMRTVIFMQRGRATCETFYGYPTAATNHDANTRIITGNFSAQFATDVKREEWVLPGMKLLPGGYVGGGNCDFIPISHYVQHLQQPVHLHSPSLLALVVGMDEGPNQLPEDLSLTGSWGTDPYFLRMQSGAPNQHHLHYSTAIMYQDVLHFSKIFAPNRRLYARSSRDTGDLVRATSIVSQGLQSVYNPVSKKLDEFIWSLSPLKNRGSIPGARATWDTHRTEFPEVDEKAQQLVWGANF